MCLLIRYVEKDIVLYVWYFCYKGMRKYLIICVNRLFEKYWFYFFFSVYVWGQRDDLVSKEFVVRV